MNSLQSETLGRTRDRADLDDMDSAGTLDHEGRAGRALRLRRRRELGLTRRAPSREPFIDAECVAGKGLESVTHGDLLGRVVELTAERSRIEAEYLADDKPATAA